MKRKSLKKNMKKRRRAQSRKGKRTLKKDVKIKTPEDRLLWKLVGVALMAFAVLFAVALASYDWQAAMVKGPAGSNCNLIGVVGNTFAHWGYIAFGFAAWCIPFALLVGSLKVLAPFPKDAEEIPNRRIVLRIIGLCLIALAVTGLFQLAGKWAWVQNLASILHIGSDAGGKVGYWFMTCGLEKCVAAFGAMFLTLGVLAVAVCMAVGLTTVRGWLTDLSEIDWAQIFGVGTGTENIDSHIDSPAEKESLPRSFLPKFGTERKTTPNLSATSAPKEKPQKIKFPVDGTLPGLNLLDPLPQRHGKTGEAEETGAKLMETLNVFGITVGRFCSPYTITRVSHLFSGIIIALFAFIGMALPGMMLKKKSL